MGSNETITTFKLEIDRLGNVLELDEYKINEAIEHGKSTLISSKFYNKGVYRVKNSDSGRLENMAINIDKIDAVTYDGLVRELGKDCVDRNLWNEVPDGEPIFFYSFKLDQFVK